MLNVRCLLPTRAKEPVIGTKEKLYARKPRASKTSTSRNLRSNWAAQCAQRSFGFVWVRVGWWRKAVGEWGMNLILRTTFNCILSLSDYCGFGKVSVLVSVESVWLSVKVLGLDSAFIKLVYWCVFFFWPEGHSWAAQGCSGSLVWLSQPILPLSHSLMFSVHIMGGNEGT